jgi:hypothetical protein
MATVSRVVLTALALAAGSPALAGEPAIFIVPLSSAGSAGTRLTQEACEALAARLADLEVSTTVATASPAWEELVAQSNASGTRLTVALEITTFGSCPRVLAPRRVVVEQPSSPVTLKGARLQEVVRKGIEAARTAESGRLAGAISKQGHWCKGPLTRAATYVLANVRSPVVVVMLPSKTAAAFSAGLAATLAEAVRGNRP